MRKFIVFEDGHKLELSPLSFDEFEKWGHWAGANDMAFNQFLYENKYTELDRLVGFNDPMNGPGLEYRRAKIVFEEGEPIFDREKIYGSDEDTPTVR